MIVVSTYESIKQKTKFKIVKKPLAWNRQDHRKWEFPIPINLDSVYHFAQLGDFLQIYVKCKARKFHDGY